LYSVTAVYLTKDFKGEIKIDKEESLDIQFFNLNELPKGLTEEYRSYIIPFIEKLSK
jgi:hypothetical protein